MTGSGNAGCPTRISSRSRASSTALSTNGCPLASTTTMNESAKTELTASPGTSENCCLSKLIAASTVPSVAPSLAPPIRVVTSAARVTSAGGPGKGRRSHAAETRDIRPCAGPGSLADHDVVDRDSDDDADAERQADRLADALVTEFAEWVPEEIVRATVHEVLADLSGASAGDVRPAEVERRARHELALWLAADKASSTSS